MKHLFFLSTFFLLVMLFPSGLNSQESKAPKAAILFTGEVNGYIEPCG